MSGSFQAELESADAGEQPDDPMPAPFPRQRARAHRSGERQFELLRRACARRGHSSQARIYPKKTPSAEASWLAEWMWFAPSPGHPRVRDESSQTPGPPRGSGECGRAVPCQNCLCDAHLQRSGIDSGPATEIFLGRRTSPTVGVYGRSSSTAASGTVIQAAGGRLPLSATVGSGWTSSGRIGTGTGARNVRWRRLGTTWRSCGNARRSSTQKGW